MEADYWRVLELLRGSMTPKKALANRDFLLVAFTDDERVLICKGRACLLGGFDGVGLEFSNVACVLGLWPSRLVGATGAWRRGANGRRPNVFTSAVVTCDWARKPSSKGSAVSASHDSLDLNRSWARGLEEFCLGLP